MIFMSKLKNETIKNIVSKTENEPELVEEQIAMGYRGYIPSNNEEETTAKWMRERNIPAMSQSNGKSKGIMHLNKDSRLGYLPKNSNMRMFDPALLMLFTDVGEFTEKIALKLGQEPSFARKLYGLRDYAINLSASIGGFEIQQQSATNVNINKAMNEVKSSPFEIFKRKGQGNEQRQ